MSRQYRVKTWIDDMGPLEFVASGGLSESLTENILWNINNTRDHDSLPRLEELPPGAVVSLERYN